MISYDDLISLFIMIVAFILVTTHQHVHCFVCLVFQIMLLISTLEGFEVLTAVLLEYNVVLFVQSQPKFQRNISLPSSGTNKRYI
jgi:hypothetical protein